MVITVNPIDAYVRWNNAIACYFFNPERAGQPVYLSVDEAVLRRIAAEWNLPVDPVTDFLQSVRNLMKPGHFFRGMYSYAEKFAKRMQPEPPLFTAGLALSILAASRMGTGVERGVAPHNYYRHLNDLLGLSSRGRPDFFNYVPELWRLLAVWLEDLHQGEFGLPTARQIGHFPFIGWPISQALVRQADAAELKVLADLAGISRGVEVAGEEIIPALRLWLQEDGAYSRLASILGTRPDAEVLGHVAGQLASFLPELEEDNADVLTPGRQLAALHLRMTGFSHAKMALELAWRCPTDLEEVEEAIGPDGEPVPIIVHGDWLGVPMPPPWFHRPVTLQFQGRVLETRLSPPLLFRRGDGLGRPGWRIHSQEVALNEDCWIACPADQLPAISESLALCGRMGRTQPNLPWLPEGWVLITDVVFNQSPAGILGFCQPRTFHPWSLQGGVRIRRNTWLAGCLPILSGPESIEFQLLDPSSTLLHTVPGGTDLNILTLPEGGYFIRGEGVRSGRLVVSSPPWPLPQPTAPRCVQLPHTAVRPSVRIQGALIVPDGPLQAPVFLPGGGDFVVLGSRVGEVDLIEGQSELGVVQWHQWFDPVWRVRIKADRVAEVLPLQRPPLPPNQKITGDVEQQAKWAEVILQARKRTGRLNHADQAVFRKYVASAAAVLGVRL